MGFSDRSDRSPAIPRLENPDNVESGKYYGGTSALKWVTATGTAKEQIAKLKQVQKHKHS